MVRKLRRFYQTIRLEMVINYEEIEKKVEVVDKLEQER